MSQQTLKEILWRLADLTADERGQLMLHLKQLVTVTVESDLQKDDWLLRGLLCELHADGIITSATTRMPLAAFAKTFPRVFPTWKKNTEVFRQRLFEDANAPSGAGLLSLSCAVARTYLTWLRVVREIEPGLPAALVNAASMPVAIEWGFPGYSASGMLGKLVKKG